MTRVGIFGWGVVAPRTPNIEAFAHNLESNDSWLEPFNGFGPDNFLVGRPEFDIEDYKEWVLERFSPNRFRQLKDKMDPSVLYAVASYIQSTQQNPGIEQELTNLGSKAHVYVGKRRWRCTLLQFAGTLRDSPMLRNDRALCGGIELRNRYV
jgi:3-oxoacyl-[acyl-carrier-protein] synthase II